mmetsp:Transcript_12212/g.23306  ORF Transcript_12212/g.23306 Transcript_12212/m.23306 type:complete len:203 (+) Transcript_12212:693-1301(+)
MLRPLVLFHAQVVLVLNVLNSVLSIHASPTHHVMTKIHTFVAQLGTMRHQIAYFPARAVKIVTAPTKRFASHTLHATIMIHSCVEPALKMPLRVNGLVRQEVVVNVLLASHALHTQHAKHQEHYKNRHLQDSCHLQDRILLHHPRIGTSQKTHFFAVHLFMMLQLSARTLVQRGRILNALLVSSASPIPRVTIEKHIIAVGV